MNSLFLLVALAAAPDVDTMFPHRARVTVKQEPSDFVRLPLTQDVLQKVQADLSDVRLLDGANRVVPFAVQRFESAGERRTAITLKTTSVERKTRGQPNAPPTYSERYDFALPERATGVPTVSLTTARLDFVRQVTFEVLNAAGGVLSTTQQPLFRLAEPGVERLEAKLPALREGAVKLRVSFEGEGSGYLEASATLVLQEAIAESPTLLWPIEAPSEQVGKTTRVHVQRPAGFVPTRLMVQTTTPWFFRRVTIAGRSGSITSGVIARKPGTPVVEVLSVPMPRTDEEELDLTFDDQDSAPLEALKLSWAIEQPELVFAGARGEYALLFGGARTRPARFDVGNFGWRSAEAPTTRVVATLGPTEANPRFSPASVLSAFRQAGAPYDVTHAPQQAQVAAWTTSDEVVTLSLTAAHADTMARDYRDVRLVDAQGRQWAYVLETSTTSVRLNAEGPIELNREPHYRAEPRGRVVGFKLVPSANTGFFNRYARAVWTEPGKAPRALWEGDLTFNPSDRGAPTRLAVTIPELNARNGTFELIIGALDDAPLEHLALEFDVVVPTLKTVAPSGSYRVLWGDPQALAPTYDLASARTVLQELKAFAVPVGPAEPNTRYVTPSLIERTGGATRWLFWAVLALAVVVLTALALRVAREDTKA